MDAVLICLRQPGSQAFHGRHTWLMWLAAAPGLLIRKITIYQGFMRYVNAGLPPFLTLNG
jgi:hypothetical protein